MEKVSVLRINMPSVICLVSYKDEKKDLIITTFCPEALNSAGSIGTRIYLSPKFTALFTDLWFFTSNFYYK